MVERHVRDVEAVGSNPVTSTIPHSDDGDKYAGVVKLADTPDLGSGVYDVGVQVPSPAPNSRNPNPKPVGEGFGFLFVFGDM